MRTSPAVSVITIAFNDLEGLKKTSSSVMCQDVSLLEHVIVDGGSTDGTVEWLEAYDPPYLSRWSSESDDGIFDAMNKGIRKSSGQLLIFMNSGDQFSSDDALSWTVENIERSGRQWGFGDMSYVDADDRITGSTTNKARSLSRLEKGLGFAPHQATIVSRDLALTLGGFDTSFSFAADQEFALRAWQTEAPVIWDRTLALFLIGGAHSQASMFERERLYHRMRIKNGRLIANSVVVDRGYAELMGTYRGGRKFLSSLRSRTAFQKQA